MSFNSVRIFLRTMEMCVLITLLQNLYDYALRLNLSDGKW